MVRWKDRNTARKIQDGDVAAFEQLVELFKGRVYSYCLRMIGDPRDGEEAAQDVFVSVYRHIAQYNADKAALSTWIFHIAHNHCANVLRHQQRRVPDATAVCEQILAAPANVIEAWELRQILIDGLNCLSDEERSLILMKDYIDLKYREIAEILQVPAGTVKTRVHVARRRLQNILRGEKQ